MKWTHLRTIQQAFLLTIISPLGISQAASLVDTGDTGSIHGTGRCLAFYNATDNPITLALDVYQRKISSWFGKAQKTEQRLVTISPKTVVSINQKPQRSFRAGLSGKYQYIKGIILDTQDTQPVLLKTSDAQKVNAYFSQNIDDRIGCKENPDRRNVAVVILDDFQLKQLGGEKQIQQQFLATFGNGYHLLLPTETVNISALDQAVNINKLDPEEQPPADEDWNSKIKWFLSYDPTQYDYDDSLPENQQHARFAKNLLMLTEFIPRMPTKNAEALLRSIHTHITSVIKLVRQRYKGSNFLQNLKSLFKTTDNVIQGRKQLDSLIEELKQFKNAAEAPK